MTKEQVKIKVDIINDYFQKQLITIGAQSASCHVQIKNLQQQIEEKQQNLKNLQEKRQQLEEEKSKEIDSIYEEIGLL